MTAAVTAALVGLEPWVAVYCLAVVFVGAVIQSSIGFGLGLVAAPVLGLADPDFVPVALLVAIAPMAFTMAVRERHHVDRTGIGWALLGRVPGSVVGAWVAARAEHTTLAIVIGVSVLLAVAASLAGIHFWPSRRNLAVAGVASGFGGTVVGIGGPPMALTYQHSNAPTLRSTLAVFFLVGLMISIVSLTLAGVMGERELKLGALLVPASLAGTGVGRLAAGHLREGKIRPIVLALCAASALALLAQQLL